MLKHKSKRRSIQTKKELRINEFHNKQIESQWKNKTIRKMGLIPNLKTRRSFRHKAVNDEQRSLRLWAEKTEKPTTCQGYQRNKENSSYKVESRLKKAAYPKGKCENFVSSIFLILPIKFGFECHFQTCFGRFLGEWATN